MVPEETIDVDVPATRAESCAEQPTLYIAVGGAGIQTLCRLLAKINSKDANGNTNTLIESIAIDTDRDELRNACSSKLKAPLLPDEPEDGDDRLA